MLSHNRSYSPISYSLFHHHSPPIPLPIPFLSPSYPFSSSSYFPPISLLSLFLSPYLSPFVSRSSSYTLCPSPVSSPIQEGRGPLTWQFAMNRASKLRREAKQLGRGRGVKSLPPVENEKEMRYEDKNEI